MLHALLGAAPLHSALGRLVSSKRAFLLKILIDEGEIGGIDLSGPLTAPLRDF